jgi:hypothetical protein
LVESLQGGEIVYRGALEICQILPIENDVLAELG